MKKLAAVLLLLLSAAVGVGAGLDHHDWARLESVDRGLIDHSGNVYMIAANRIIYDSLDRIEVREERDDFLMLVAAFGTIAAITLFAYARGAPTNG